jgi:hypothetical protein
LLILKLLIDGIRRPVKMADALAKAPAPAMGLQAVLFRFILTSITSLLALQLLHRLPFAPSELVNLPIEKYYFAEVFFLPVWGVAIWVLMSSVVYLVLQLGKITVDYGKILNAIGIGMLVPMPVLWVWDWIAIGLNIYTVTNQAVSHSIALSWGAIIQVICITRLLKVKLWLAVILIVVANAMYVALAMHFIR